VQGQGDTNVQIAMLAPSQIGFLERRIPLSNAVLTRPQAQAANPMAMRRNRTTRSRNGRLILTMKIRGRSAQAISVAAKSAVEEDVRLIL